MNGEPFLRTPLSSEVVNSKRIVNGQEDGSPRCSLDFRLSPSGQSAFGAETLLLQKFSGTESTSQPFEFKLEILAGDSHTLLDEAGRQWLSRGSEADVQGPANPNNLTFSLDDLIGRDCTVMLGLAETDEEVERDYPEARSVEYFNGVISKVSMKDGGGYEATLKPALIKLGLQNHYRIFTDMTILEAIAEILTPYNILWRSDQPDIIKGLAKYRRQDWVQAGETDIDFFHRLVQKAGLVYYFVHSYEQHEMILTDQAYYQPITLADESIQELFLFYTKTGQDTENHITQFSFEQNLMPDSVELMLAEQEPSWLSDDNATIHTNLTEEAFNPALSQSNALKMHEVHRVSYGASEYELGVKSKKTALKLSAGTKSFSGATNCPRLRSGFWFVVREAQPSLNEAFIGADSPSPGFYPIRPDVDGLSFVATSVSHNADVNGSYSNQFSALETSAFPGAYEAKGDPSGTIIGQIVDNGAIADSHFLSKTDFSIPTNHFSFNNNSSGKPDFYPSKNGQGGSSSGQPGLFVKLKAPGANDQVHWVRLASHMTSAPEEGTYVLIGKSSDETEVPEIQQVIEQKGSKNIVRDGQYSVNANWGDSYSTSFGDSARINLPNNAITNFDRARDFVASKRQANRFGDVSYSESSSVSFNASIKSHSISLSGNLPRNLDPHRYIDAEDSTGEEDYIQYSKAMTFGSTMNRSMHEGDSHSISKQTGTAFSDSTVGNTVSTSSVGTSTSNSNVGVSTSESNIGESTSISVVGLSNTDSNVGVSNSLSVVGVSDSQSNVLESNSESNTGVSNSMSLTGVSDSTSLVGDSNSMSLVGVSESMSLVGDSNGTSLTGASNQVNLTGESTAIHITGESTAINITGNSTTLNIQGPENKINMNESIIEIDVPGLQTKIILGLLIHI